MTYVYFSFALLGIVAVSSQDEVSGAFPCKQTITQKLASGVEVSGLYDLCQLVQTHSMRDGWYEAIDNRTVGNEEARGSDAVNYTFYYNIADNVAKSPPDAECDNWDTQFRNENHLQLGYCSDITEDGECAHDDIVPIKQRVAAYQAKRGPRDEDNTKCMRLHDGVTEPEWTFLDDSDPAYGIKLTYTNGDFCHVFGRNREFQIKLKCTKDVTLDPAEMRTVYEPVGDGCIYEIEIDTVKACPYECPVSVDGELCNGFGVCDYDWTRGKPKCFCYTGWYGDGCLESEDPGLEVIHKDSDDTYVGGLVVVILLLCVILVIVGYLFMKYTRIQSQPFDFNFLESAKRKKRNEKDEYNSE